MPQGLAGMLRQYSCSARAGGKDRLGNAVNNKVRVAADGRSEVGVARCGPGEVALIFFAVARLPQGTEHEMSEDALLRLARDLERQLLIHARGDGNILRDLVLARLAALACAAASSTASHFAPFRLHSHALHRQWAQAKRVAKTGSHAL